MILKNSNDRKKLARELHRQVKELSLEIKYQEVLECLAKSIDCSINSDNAFVAVLNEGPLYVDAISAATVFSEIINSKAIKADDSQEFTPSMFKYIVEDLDRYPVVAGFDERVFFNIYWDLGYISEPRVAPSHEIPYVGQYSDHASQFTIQEQISQDEFEALKSEIKPYVNIVYDGLRKSGEDLSDDLVQTQDEVAEIVERHIENLSNYCSRTSAEFFGDGFPDFNDLYENESVEIIFEGDVFLNHETTDLQLQQIVAIEILHDDSMKDLHLFRDLRDYRDTCKEHYLNSQ